MTNKQTKEILISMVKNSSVWGTFFIIMLSPTLTLYSHFHKLPTFFLIILQIASIIGSGLLVQVFYRIKILNIEKNNI